MACEPRRVTERKAFTVEYGSGVAEAERGMDSFERKDITSWRAGRSFEDRDNFVTNRVTVAEYNDAGRESGIGISATYACVKLLAGTIASLPVMVYRTNGQGVRQVDKAHPLYNVLHSSPNFDQTAVDFWEFVSAGVELRGNSSPPMVIKWVRISSSSVLNCCDIWPTCPSLLVIFICNSLTSFNRSGQ